MTVSELIRHRESTNSTPSARDDDAKLGLIIEGGGMRGVVSAGMVAALETLGLLRCFDAVYGSSAGAINGAYFIAGQARYGSTIYYQDISNAKFINVFRPLIGQPVVSLEFLLDFVAERTKPLAWDRVINSKIPLIAVASSLCDGKEVRLRDFTSKGDLRECLRGSARIPVLAGRPVYHRGLRLWDAIIFEEIPLRAACEDNCTHVMALLTKPRDKADYDLNVFERHAMAEFIGLGSRSARRAYQKNVHLYGPTVRALASGNIEWRGKKGIASLAVQVSSENSSINGVEHRHTVLVNGARAGFEAVYELLALPLPQVVEVLTAYE